MNIELLLNDDSCKFIQDEYKFIYDHYTDNISNKVMATSLQQCSILYLISKNLFNKNILDTGSGISSYFLRKNKKLTNSINYTVDTNLDWLLKTKNFLKEYQVNDENLFEWSDFKNKYEIKFDFIYHDMGWIHERMTPIPYIKSMLYKNGIIMIDDLHFNNSPDCMLRDFVYDEFTPDNWLEVDIKSISMDEYGRYATIFIKK